MGRHRRGAGRGRKEQRHERHESRGEPGAAAGSGNSAAAKTPHVAHDLIEKDQPEQGEGHEQNSDQRAIVLSLRTVPLRHDHVGQEDEVDRQRGALERGDDAL